jgi:hypothetical protein
MHSSKNVKLTTGSHHYEIMLQRMVVYYSFTAKCTWDKSDGVNVNMQQYVLACKRSFQYELPYRKWLQLIFNQPWPSKLPLARILFVHVWFLLYCNYSPEHGTPSLAMISTKM